MTETQATQSSAVRVRSFSRVTVVGPRGQANLAVPDDMSMPDLVRSAVDALGETPSSRWRIEHPTAGVLGWRETLASVQVRDGTVLHLRTDPEATAEVMADDVPESVSETVEGWRAWSPQTARLTGSILLGGWLGAAAVGATWRGLPWWLALVCYAVSLLGVGLARVARLQRPGLVLALLSLVPAASCAWALTAGWEPLAAGIAAAALAVVLACVLLRVLAPLAWPAARPVAVAAAVSLAAAGLCAVAGVLGLEPAQVWSLVLLAAMLALSFLTPVGAMLARLGQADDDVVDGRGAKRRAVQAAVESALAEMVGAGLALSVTASVAAAQLSWTGNVAGVWLAGLGLVAVFLRGRTYRHAPLALAISVPAFVAAAALALGAAGDVTAYLTVVVIGAVALGVFALRAAGPVTASRLRMFADRLETLALVACVPVALAVWDLYALVAGRF